MTPTLEELAEDTAVHLLPRAGFDQIDRGSYFFEAGPLRAAVQRIRLGDVEAAVAWTRDECGAPRGRDGRVVGSAGTPSRPISASGCSRSGSSPTIRRP